MLAEALEFVHKTGERNSEVELYRLYGELSLRIGEPETGRTEDKKILPDSPIPRFFSRGILPEGDRNSPTSASEVAGVTRSDEPSEAMGRQQGKKAEARQMLAEIYGWFTEGFDTKDLQEAKALLQELAREATGCLS